MRTFIVILATIALATALPSAEDDVVPEELLVQTVAEESYDAHAEAKRELEFLQTQEGRSDKACKDLANGTLREINTSINTQQRMLDRLYRGQNCHKEGRKAWDESKKRLTHAKNRLRDAVKRLNQSRNRRVDFGRYTFSGLREGNCGVFWQDRNYRSAKSLYERHVREERQRRGEERAATQSERKFRDAHHRAVKRCRCNVRTQHEKSWKSANRNNAANAKAWTKAKHMLCVLAGTAQKNCNIKGLRSLRKPSLSSAVRGARCAEQERKPKCTGHVEVWQHNFSGWRARFRRGSYTLSQAKKHGFRNDDASSVVVPNGCKADLYEHSRFNGWRVRVGPGRYSLSALRKKGFKNDRMSSIKVHNN